MNNNLEELINVDNIRKTIKRLFENNIYQCFGELLQNSQRAGATTVNINIVSKDCFTYEDNGHGLKPELGTTLDGFHILLKLAETGYDDHIVENQEPMGIGLHSLFAHDKIKNVTFECDGLSLSIDTERWWEDKEYYSTWYNRIKTTDNKSPGLKITVLCKIDDNVPEYNNVLEKIKALFNQSNSLFSYQYSPACGYKGILNVNFNGEPQITEIPDWALLKNPFLEFEYKGCSVKIEMPSSLGYTSQTNSSVNWYGQQIKLDNYGYAQDWHRFRILMTVRNGRPINPMAPTRNGFIKDEKYTDFVNYVKDRIFEYVFDVSNKDKITADFIESCYWWDKDKAISESPYFLAKPVWGKTDTDCFERENPDGIGTCEMFLYEDPILLVETEVSVHLDADPSVVSRSYCSGFSSFVKSSANNNNPNAYNLYQGDSKRLNIAYIHWKPGEVICDNIIVCEPGKWSLVYEYTEDIIWEPIDEKMLPVYAFSDTSSYTINDSDIVVGVNDPIDFFDSNYVWVCWAEDEDGDYDEQQKGYQESIDDIIRKLIGGCIKRNFTLGDVKMLCNVRTNSLFVVDNIKYIYEDGIARLRNNGGIYDGITPSHIIATVCKKDGSESIEKKFKLFGT